ncbi:MAG: hypothetical protein J0L81_12920 [Caulobacterales bacterium]|jgi:hypothetical protein|nr:hypothetical protein [Caulobacterales bacterium]
MQPRRSQPRPFRAPKALAALLALVALAIQALAVQTHVHAYAPVAAAGLAQDAAPHDAHLTATHEQSVCFVCQALAASGGALITPNTAPLGAHAAPIQTTRVALPAPPRALTHSWRSRAPPVSL